MVLVIHQLAAVSRGYVTQRLFCYVAFVYARTFFFFKVLQHVPPLHPERTSKVSIAVAVSFPPHRKLSSRRIEPGALA